MKAKHYTIDKEKYNQETVKMNNKLNGFQVSPQNNVEYPGVEVNSMLVVKPSFIEKIVKKKTKRKQILSFLCRKSRNCKSLGNRSIYFA